MTNKERRGWVAFNSNLKSSIQLLLQLKKYSRKKFDFNGTFSEKDLSDYVQLFRFEMMRVQNYLARANFMLDQCVDNYDERKKGGKDA